MLDGVIIKSGEKFRLDPDYKSAPQPLPLYLPSRNALVQRNKMLAKYLGTISQVTTKPDCPTFLPQEFKANGKYARETGEEKSGRATDREKSARNIGNGSKPNGNGNNPSEKKEQMNGRKNKRGIDRRIAVLVDKLLSDIEANKRN